MSLRATGCIYLCREDADSLFYSSWMTLAKLEMKGAEWQWLCHRSGNRLGVRGGSGFRGDFGGPPVCVCVCMNVCLCVCVCVGSLTATAA